MPRGDSSIAQHQPAQRAEQITAARDESDQRDDETTRDGRWYCARVCDGAHSYKLRSCGADREDMLSREPFTRTRCFCANRRLASYVSPDGAAAFFAARAARAASRSSSRLRWRSN